MKLIRLLLTGLLIASCLPAAGVMMLDAGPGLTGSPGDTIGWGFTLTWTSPDEWASVTGSALINETNPVGLYTDFIGPQGGPDPFFALGPAATPWTESFDAVNSLGLGSYAIDPAAVPLSLNTGQIIVFFDIFDGNPMLGGNQVGSDSVTTNFSVQVDSPVPEPSSLWMVLSGVIAAAVLRVIKRRARSGAFPEFPRVASFAASSRGVNVAHCSAWQFNVRPAMRRHQVDSRRRSANGKAMPWQPSGRGVA